MKRLAALVALALCLSGCARTYRSAYDFDDAVARIAGPVHREPVQIDLQAMAEPKSTVTVRELTPADTESLLVITEAMPPWPFQLRRREGDVGTATFDIVSDTSGIYLHRGRLILGPDREPDLVRLDCDVDEVRAWVISRLALYPR